jgi:NADH dehydrogenase FAD-containing subunit
VEQIDVEGGKIISKVDVDADADGGTLRVRHDETPFDYLVLAPGSTTQTFNTPGAQHAFFMRELGDAIALRNHIIDCFETAAREADRELTRKMLRFVVIGAGPTGVEVASEVRDLIDKVLLPRYPEVDASLVDVVLIDFTTVVKPTSNGGQVFQRRCDVVRTLLEDGTAFVLG